jgi:hypothetical protein
MGRREQLDEELWKTLEWEWDVERRERPLDTYVKARDINQDLLQVYEKRQAIKEEIAASDPSPINFYEVAAFRKQVAETRERAERYAAKVRSADQSG